MSVLLQVENLSKSFRDEQFKLLGSRYFQAVADINFRLAAKQTLSIIGRNGSGKSTLVKMIAGIIPPSSGNILFKGKPLVYGDYGFRAKHIRMLFQDTNSSFNPRSNVGQILDSPLRLATALDEQQRNEKIGQTLRMVGLYPDHANIPITATSLSQKQRIALARAVILEPEIIIIDDSISALDASVKTQLVNLMLDLQQRLGIAYIYVGQNLGLIKHISDQVLVMEEGKMVELGTPQQLFTQPTTEITHRLVESYFGKMLDKQAWQTNEREEEII